MNLYLDDVRKCPPGFMLARNYDEAIKLLETGRVQFASLDHDLCDEDILKTEGFKEKTGYDVVLWMKAHNVWPPDGVVVHSMNPVGRARMEAVIEQAYGGPAT